MSTPASELRWTVLHDPPTSGARNMARDEALARSLGDDRAVLRLYSWERPTISFGRNEPARGRYSEERGAALGYAFVRRPTGGRAVLHDDELTYAVVMPLRAAGGVRAAYRRINEALARALVSLGAPVAVAEGDGVAPLDAGPCFQSPASGEIVAAGRKLVGSAQAKIGRSLLQHGSLLLGGDQSGLSSVSLVQEDLGDPVTLGEMAPGARSQDVAEAMVGAMQAEFGGTWSVGEVEGSTDEVARELMASRYGSEAWTWRL